MALKTRTQQPTPVSANVELPPNFPAIPQEILDRFQTAADWQKRLDDFWSRTGQALQEAQQQAANYANSRVTYSVDQFLIYAKNGSPQPMFALDDTGIRLGNVLVINTPALKMYIGAGTYQSDDTPFYVDVDGKFSLGSKLTWDPVSATLTITGTIVATSGTIGGFDIGADYIRDAANSFGLASTVTGGDDVRFWAGNTFANRAVAPFRVTEAGILNVNTITSTGITITGGTLTIATSTARLGVGGSTPADTGISYRGTLNASVGNCVGISSIGASFVATANGDFLAGIMAGPLSVSKGAFTGLTLSGLYVSNPSSSGAGAIDNHYGLYIETPNRGTTNYSIYSAGGNNVLLGGLNSTPIGATTPSTGAFTTFSATGSVSIFGASTQTTFIRINGQSATQAAGIQFQSSGTSKWTVGRGINTGDDGLYIYNESLGANLLTANITTNAVTFGGSIQSAAPTGGAGAWKLGKYTAGVLAQAGSVLVNVDGVDRVFLTA